MKIPKEVVSFTNTLVHVYFGKNNESFIRHALFATGHFNCQILRDDNRDLSCRENVDSCDYVTFCGFIL